MNNNIISIWKKLLPLVVLLICVSNAKATHIVGGTMNYTCLGNDNYEIQLTIYRDCFYADPLAFFDDPAYIGVFDQNNMLVSNLQLPLLNNDTIPAVLNDPCLFVPDDVCVHTTTYRGTINLPFRPGGYQLAYERCCRNETILNIIDPLNAGAIYNTIISETALQECNSSAKFKEWPPLFVCVNEPIDWDHSANDTDGDSLVYSLCTPLSGGSQADPQPIPTNNPPFNSVIWNDPAYNLDNLLGGDPLTIDSKTGRLRAVPSIMGQFVVGVCVTEYRNGQKISETRRDFQYNVGECGMVESTIVAPSVQCEDLSVRFTNESQNADGYLWNFNDPNNPGASSTEAEPIYTYSEPGTYTIELIASTRTVCTDTSYHTIFLQRNSMISGFAVDVQDCVNSSTLRLTDQSVDPVSAPSSWDWVLKENGLITQMSAEQNPIFQVSAPASIELSLTTTSQNGCVDGDSQTFGTQIKDPNAQIASDITVCIGTDSQLNPNPSPGFEYTWVANPLFDDLSNPNPTVNISQPAQLEVTISASEECSATKIVRLAVEDIPAINNIEDQHEICNGSSVVLNETNYPDLIFSWSGDNISDENSDIPSASPTSNATYGVTITEASGLSCSLEKTVNVIVNDLPEPQLALISDQFTVCHGASATLNPNATAGFEYTWEANPFFDDLSNPNPTINIDQNGQLEVTVSSPEGCSLSKQIDLVAEDIFPINTIVDQHEICNGSSVMLNETNYPDFNFSWSGSGLDNLGSDNPTASPSSTTTYSVTITRASGLACRVDKDVNVIVNELPETQLALISDQFTVCHGASATLNPNAAGGFEYTWKANPFFDDLSNPNPTINIDQNGQLEVTISSPEGCSLSKQIDLVAEDVFPINSIADQHEICNGSSVILNETNYPDFNFEWSGGGLDIPGSDNPTASPSSTTTYSVTVTRASGLACSVNKDVNVIVNELPEQQLALVSDQTTVCRGSSTTLNPNGDANFNYTWDGLGLSNVTILNPTVGPSESTSYDVRVTNRNTGCFSEKAISVFVPEDINLSVQGDRDICFNSETTLQAVGVGPLNFAWSNNEGSLISSESMLLFQQNESADIQLRATNTSGCSEALLVRVNVADRVDVLDNLPDSVLVCENIPTSLSSNENDQFDFLWSPAINLDDATTSIPIFTANETTIYAVEATNPTNGCKAQKSLKAVVPQSIDLAVSDDLTTCGEEQIILNASSETAESYTWIRATGAGVGTTPSVTVDPRLSAQYIVEAVDQYGCFVTDSVRVTYVGIDAKIANDDIETCDDEVQLSLADMNGNSANSYVWGPEEAIISGSTTSNPIVLNNGNDPITFMVTITNTAGCVVQDQVTLTNRFDLESLNVGINACADIDLKLNPNFNSDYTYSWQPSNLLDNPNSPNPTFTPTGDQVFNVTVMDADGCMTEREVSVTTVDLNDMVDISIAADTILDGESTQLEVTFDPDFTYLWIPPTSLSNNTISNPIASPSQRTNYSVMVQNSQGCVATKTITLTVLSSECDEPFVFFPNAFTPNGDGVNDVLRVRGNALSEVRFVIYDRWGERIFETNSIDGQWDGTYKGKLLPPDVYGYYLEAKCIFGGEFKKQGNVTLLD